MCHIRSTAARKSLWLSWRNRVVLFENNNFTEICSGSEAGSYLRLIDFVYHSTLGLRVKKKQQKRLFIMCTTNRPLCKRTLGKSLAIRQKSNMRNRLSARQSLKPFILFPLRSTRMLPCASPPPPHRFAAWWTGLRLTEVRGMGSRVSGAAICPLAMRYCLALTIPLSPSGLQTDAADS